MVKKSPTVAKLGSKVERSASTGIPNCEKLVSIVSSNCFLLNASLLNDISVPVNVGGKETDWNASDAGVGPFTFFVSFVIFLSLTEDIFFPLLYVGDVI